MNMKSKKGTKDKANKNYILLSERRDCYDEFKEDFTKKVEQNYQKT